MTSTQEDRIFSAITRTAAQTRVMDAALKLIAERGVSGTSLQMIADEMGVTKAAVYRQFKTKEEIVIAITEREMSKLEETLEALAGFVQQGKVRYLGWSNVRTWRLERIRGLCERNGWPLPVAVQQQHSYLRPRAGLASASIVDAEQLDYLRDNDDQTLVAYSPIVKGIYDSPEKRTGHWMMDSYAGPDTDARLTAVTEVAAEAGVTPKQLVLAWLLHQTAPRVVPLIGPRTPEQFENALPALEVKLTEDQLNRLDEAGA